MPTPPTSGSRFLALPEELRFHILEYLSPSDVAVSICRVSRRLQIIAESDSLWRTYFDSLWEPSVKKEYQANGKLEEYLGLPSLIKAFKAAIQEAHPEAIRKEYLYLHPKTKELVKTSEGVSDVRSRKKSIQQKTLEETLEGAAYASCVLFYPPLLCFVVEGVYYQDAVWVGNIYRKYPEKVLDMLKNHQLLENSVGLEKAAHVVACFAEASSETTTYFLQSEPLLRIYLEGDADDEGKLEVIKVLQEMVEDNVKVLPEAVQSFLGHKELLKKYFKSPKDQAWIEKTKKEVQRVLENIENTEAYTATMSGP